MSQWHREHPELEGVEGADPWMEHESHRQAREELVRMGLVFVEEEGDEE
jgi:hypothetical protein